MGDTPYETVEREGFDAVLCAESEFGVAKVYQWKQQVVVGMNYEYKILYGPNINGMMNHYIVSVYRDLNGQKQVTTLKNVTDGSHVVF